MCGFKKRILLKKIFSILVDTKDIVKALDFRKVLVAI